MGTDEIRAKIKLAIAKVSNLDPVLIADGASFHEDLGLDSLSILETIVEVQCRFQIPDLPDTDYSGIRTVDAAVRFVQERMQLEAV